MYRLTQAPAALVHPDFGRGDGMAALLGLMCRSWCLVAAAASDPGWGVCSLSGTASGLGGRISVDAN
jgi:hypothetical protein